MRHLPRLLTLLLALLLPGLQAFSAPPADTLVATPDYDVTIVPDTVVESQRPRLGLVLSGGGAKGLAHIGVLKVMERAGLDADVVTGTSMGSIIGGLYSIGYTAEEIDTLVMGLDWQEFFSDQPSRRNLAMEQKLYDARYLVSLPLREGTVALPNGLIPGQNFSTLLNRLTWFVHDVDNFHNLPRSFACVATDLVTGKAVVLDHGQLSEAIRASMAIPSIFTPVQYQGHLLVDGGLVRNLPVQDARAMDADIVIAVDVGMPLRSREKLTDLLTIVNQALSFIGSTEDSLQRSMADILIEPPVEAYSITDFQDARAIIDAGEQAATPYLGRFRAIADSLDRLGPPPPRPLPPQIDSVYVERVETRGLVNVTRRQVLADFGIDAPRWVTPQELDDGISRVYSSQFFERVSYQLTSTSSGTILTLKLLEKRADQFRFGFRYDNFTKASVVLNLTFHNLLFNSTMAAVDLILGDNSRLEGSYYFHTGYRQRLGLRLNAFYEEGDFDLPRPGATPVPMSTYRTRADFLAGTIFSTSSVLGAGIRYEWAVARPRYDIPNIRDVSFSYPSLYALFWTDTFDRANFAHEGGSFYSEFEVADSSFGTAGSFQRIEVVFESRSPLVPHVTAIGRARLGSMIGNPPLTRWLVNRPFGDLVNAEPGERAGRAMQAVGLGLQFEPFKRRYIVVQADLGNTFDAWNTNFALDRYDWGFGLTVGASTPVGPIDATVSTGSLHDVLFAVNVGFHF